MTGRLPGLDGIRGIAILLVLGYHLAEPWWVSAFGNLGVTMFFTLSGFLITGLLLDDADELGRVRWRHFYARRALRLVPALLVFAVLVFTVQRTAGIGSNLALVPVLGYVSNWALVAGANLGWLGHTWSLAVEAQFYLLWPPLFAVLARRRDWALGLTLAGIAASIVTRIVLWDGGAGSDRVYYSSDTRADGLLVGCALALLLARGVRPRVRPALVGAAAAVLVALVVVAGPSRYLNAVGVPTVTPWFTAALILLAISSPGLLAARTLAWWGDRSYGIYLWHFSLIRAADNAAHSVPVLIAAGVLGVLVADLSWRYLERPLLRQPRPAVA